MRVLHIVPSLTVGGAERALANIILNDTQNQHAIVCLVETDSPLKQLFNENRIEIYTLIDKKTFYSLFKLRYLYTIIKKYKPEIVQTWMYHCDLIGGIIAKSLGVKVIVWNVRNSDLLKSGISPSTRFVAFLCSKLSRTVPDKIICVSERAYETHGKMGYYSDKMIVIPNGVDTERFKMSQNMAFPDVGGLKYFREKFKYVVCSVGRVNFYKDYETLLKVARKAELSAPDLGFIVVGRGASKLLDQSGLQERFSNLFLVEHYSNIEEFYNICDIFCLHSRSEGHPNVLLEAMSMGLACVTTDAGDARTILNSHQYVLKPGDEEGLLNAIIQLKQLNPVDLRGIGLLNRNRIIKNFSLRNVVSSYNALYCHLLREKCSVSEH